MASEKQKVALVSLVASAVLAAAKLVAAVFTGSLGILSEAIHSLLDTGATAITFAAVSVSDRPPDDTHHFGHAKVESVAALTGTALLFITTGWIVYEAIHRLLTGGPCRGRMVGGRHRRRLDRHRLQPLRALNRVAGHLQRGAGRRRAAFRHRHVELDRGARRPRRRLGRLPLGRLGRGAGGRRLRGARRLPARQAHARHPARRRAARHRGGHRAAGRRDPRRSRPQALRVRPAGATLFVDADITVRRTLPFDRVAEIQRRFVEAVRGAYPNSDVSVTVHPVALDDETVFDKVNLIAARAGRPIHHLTVQHVGDKLSVSFDLELDRNMDFTTAHDVATALENAISDELGEEVEVESHIEPLHIDGLSGAEVAPIPSTSASRPGSSNWPTASVCSPTSTTCAPAQRARAVRHLPLPGGRPRDGGGGARRRRCPGERAQAAHARSPPRHRPRRTPQAGQLRSGARRAKDVAEKWDR
jgi:divalent metal cation (Fe/Co/Zn/Cd) transporter